MRHGIRTAGPAELGGARAPSRGLSGGGRPRPAWRRWLAEVGLGARLVVAGGREGRLRTGLTALGLGFGVALLLLAVSIPTMLAARGERDQQRDIAVFAAEPAANTVLVRVHGMEFRGQQIWGVEVWPDGPDASLPPGMAALPGDGELMVSPALGRLLDSPDGELLRPRLDYPVVGLIGAEGLRGPRDLAFYLGNEELAAAEVGPGGLPLASELVARLDRFGFGAIAPVQLSPLLVLLLVIGVVALLLPVAIFVAVAARFGGEQRDRRLAALRLVGAGAAATGRIAAAEALVSALLGLAVGAAGFLAARHLMEVVTIGDLNVFAADVWPDPVLGAVVLVAVPVLVVMVTLLAMRRVTVEPLGVVRQAKPARRRVWWRLLLPAGGLLLLLSPGGQAGGGSGELAAYQSAAGAVLVLVGVAAVLPWLVDTLAGRLRGGGPVSWQLAVRRLQLSGGSTGRVVNGVAVAVAGAIALQLVFATVSEVSVTRTPRPAADAGWVNAVDSARLARAYLEWTTDQAETDQITGRFAATPGVRAAAGVRMVHAQTGGGADLTMAVGSCAALAALADLDSCVDGDVFAMEPGSGLVRGSIGQVLAFWHPDGDQTWPVPGDARTATGGWDPFGFPVDLLATPGAGVPHVPGNLSVYLELDPAQPDAIEQVRNTAAAVDRFMQVRPWQPVQVDENFAMFQRALLAGVTATLMLIGLSLLVGTVEQLRERRRQLAVLVAFGTRRRTLAWSVLWQTAIPVALGLLLAAGAGLGLGFSLLAFVEVTPVVDLPGLALITGIAAAVVLVVTVSTLPLLGRLMRPAGLRTE